jgi:hypothetical protein
VLYRNRHNSIILTDSEIKTKKGVKHSELFRAIAETSEWDDTSDAVELELRKWLGIVPWPGNIRQHSIATWR